MARKRKEVKVHFSVDTLTHSSICGLKTRIGNVTSNFKEVTCCNCLRRFKGKERK